MNCKECKERLYPENPEVGCYNPHTKRYLTPLCQGCPNAYQKEEAELRDRISNLAAISAESGRIPRAYYDRFQQIQGELAYLRNKVTGESAKPVKRPVLSQGVKL